MTHSAERLLDDLYGHILTGSFDTLPKLLPALQAEFENLAPDPASDLVRLKAKAERNAACLDAALSGLRAGRRRLAEIAAAQQGLMTYDSSGSKHLLDQSQGKGHRA